MNDPYRPMFGRPIAGWFRWFAWRPVWTEDRGWRWLRPVWRRRIEPKVWLDDYAGGWFQNVVALDKSE